MKTFGMILPQRVTNYTQMKDICKHTVNERVEKISTEVNQKKKRMKKHDQEECMGNNKTENLKKKQEKLEKNGQS